MNCPVCNAPLAQMPGNQMHPGDPEHGWTVWCPATACPPQEVAGHGNTVKAAYEIVKQRFPKFNE
jgi:hypothetical protein